VQRLTNNVVLAFDADSAGFASIGRAAMLALARGMEVKVCAIPHGKDPADCIKTDVHAWKHAVKNSLHVVDYMLTTVIAQHTHGDATDERALVLAVRDTVLPYIACIHGGVHQAHFVRRVAQALGLSEDAVREDVRNATKERAPITRNVGLEGEHVAKPLAHEPVAPVTRKEVSERALAGFLFWQETLEPRLLQDTAVVSEAERLSVDVSSIFARWSAHRAVVALEAEITYAHSVTTTQPEELFGILLANVAREYKQEELDCIMKELRLSEHMADEVKSRMLLTRINELSRCIDALAR
jgi:DNA primase